MAQLLPELRKAFGTGKTLPLAYRRTQLQNLLKLCVEKEREILDALFADLRKGKFEASLELAALKQEIQTVTKNLEKWTGDEKMPPNILTPGDRAYIRKDPLGVVLILGPWNYPILLSLGPLVGAIAAGNCAVVKVSEVSQHSGALMARLVPQYLDQECFRVYEGDVAATVKLLEERFDYIFATGSPAVGRSVMAAAATHLTPVTLELGGKNPAYIDDKVDLELAARRIWWTKTTNLGQLCLSPDYILISKQREPQFVEVSRKVLNQMFGSDWKKSGDLGRFINERHFLRFKKILESTKGRIAFGGDTDQTDLWISPTLILDVDPKTDSTAEDELFGPVLSVINVESPEEAIDFINARPKPLALYAFTDNQKMKRKFVERTSSGGVCINDTFLHVVREGLPFGGVGNSGMGHYHGEYTVNTFCHKKSVLDRSTSLPGELVYSSRYAPHTRRKTQTFLMGFKYSSKFILPKAWRTQFAVPLAVAATAAIVYGLTY